MNRAIVVFFFVFVSKSLFAQTQSAKGTGIHYFKVEPTMPVNVCYDAEVGIDTSTGFWWEYSRDFGFWIPAGFRIQRVVGCVKPNYIPVDKQSYVVINDCDSLYRWRNGAWWHLNKYIINTDNQDLSIGGNGPTYTIDITNGQGVTIAPGGIITLNESPANTLIISAIEIDGDTTNEIQVIDTFSIVNDTLRLSISKDNEPFKFVNLSPYRDNTDLSYTGTSSPVTLNSSTGADVTITAGTNVTLSATSTNLTINAQGDNWGTQVAQVTARLSGNGTSSSPLDIAQQGATSGQVLKWNGTAWEPANDNDNQTLSVAGQNLTISNGNTVTLPGDDWGAQVAQVTARLSGNGTSSSPLDIAQQGATTGQVLKWNGTSWAPAADNLGVTDLSYSGTSSPVTLNSSTGTDVTITAGTNVTLSATSTNLTINAQGDNWGTQVAQTTARLSGNGTSSSPLDIAQQGATTGQVLKWNGTAWAPAADNLGVTDLSYSGTSSPITLNSSTGTDVTITAGTNVTLSATSNNLTINAQGDNWGTQVAQITARLSGNGTSANPLDIAQQGATSGQVLKWNGTSWGAPAADNTGTTDLSFSGTSSPVTLNSSSGADVTITAGTNVTLSATSTNLTINATGGDGSETKVQGANGIQVTGTGTTPNPYIISPPSGSDAQTLRYNGSTLVTSSMLTNNVIGIGINTLPVSPYKLAIKQVTATDGVQIITQGTTNKGLFFGNVSGSSNIYADTFTLKLAAESQIRLEPVGGASQLNQIVFYPMNTITSTSSNANLLNLSPRYYPVNPGGNFAYLFHAGEINQTSTSNQDVYMIRSNPNIISLKGQLHGWLYQPAVGRFLWQPNGDTVYSHLRGRLGLGPAATTSTHRLFVDGTMRLTGSTGTATTLMGRNANGEVAAITVGSNLTLSGNTLSATGGGLAGAESGLYVNNNNARLGGTLLENVAIEGGTSEFYLQLRRLNFRYSRYNVVGTNWRQYFSVRGVAANPTTAITPTTDAIAEFGGETSAGNSTKQVLAIGAMATQANGLWLQARNNDTFNIHFPLHINPRGGNVAVGVGASNPAARFTVGSYGLTGTGVAGLTALLYQSEGHGETRLGFGTTVSAHNGAISFRFADDVFRFINLNSTNNTSRIAFSVGGYDAANEKVAFVHTTASSKVRAGFGQTDPAQIHSTVQVAGSLATAYTETTSALTLNETHHTVVFTGTSNVTFTIPTASSCACAGRQYIIHNVSASSVVTLSQSVTKANASTFNTVNAGEWAYIVYGTSTIRGYKLTSN